MRLAAHVADMETKQNTDRALVRKPEQQRQLGRHGGRWENNDIMSLKKQDGREME